MSEHRAQAVYMQIYYRIINDIIENQYQPGDFLPTQNEYAERFCVSRLTVREAVKELCRRGIVETTRGKGTILIKSPDVLGEASRVNGLSSRKSGGYNTAIHSKVISISKVKANPTIAGALHIPVDTLLTHIVRIRIKDGKPACLDKSYLIDRYVEGIDFSREDLETGSLYCLLKREKGLEFAHIIEQFRAVVCPKDVASLLQINEGEPVLKIQRVSMDQEGRAVEYCENYDRSDLWFIVIETTQM